ncbi:MAG: leucine-rich repeat domain-containing protein [Clostridia bacterium]|nr:leucine-rich repeat domain-containing protein [Clostridia bacterium]
MKKTVILLCLLCFCLVLLCACTEVEGDDPVIPEVENGGVTPPTGGSSHVHYLTHREAVDPVCGTPGNIEYWECAGCGAYFADERGNEEILNQRSVILRSQVHTSEIAYSETEHWTRYTCACRLPSDGYEAHDALADCAVCGYRAGTDGLKYTLNSNTGTYAVSGIGKATGDIVIASIYDGKPVTEIAAHAFASATQMTGVYIPDSITAIGAHAFRNCTGLNAVEIPGSITKIDESVFSMCEGLVSVTFLPTEEGGESPVTEIGQWAFRGCHSLERIEIPSNVTTIAYNAFYDCTSLKTVVLPNELVSIESYAFDGCSNLLEITLPESVVNIGTDAFRGCTKLLKIENGLHYVGDWIVSADRDLTTVNSIREGTVGIAFGAFANSAQLAFVSIPASVCYIGAGAFEGCDALTSVVFENRDSWYCVDLATDTYGINIYASELLTPSTAAIYLTSTYVSRFWKCV